MTYFKSTKYELFLDGVWTATFSDREDLKRELLKVGTCRSVEIRRLVTTREVVTTKEAFA